MDETLKMGAALAADNVAEVVTLYLHGGVELDALSDTLLDDGHDAQLLRGCMPNGKRFAVPARNILIIVEDENGTSDR